MPSSELLSGAQAKQDLPLAVTGGESAALLVMLSRRLQPPKGLREGKPECLNGLKIDDEVASPHSITSSAVASSKGGTVTPSAAAVFRLITRSNFSGRCIGKSVGLAPCRILPT